MTFYPTQAVQLRTDTSALRVASGQGRVHVLQPGQTLREVATLYGVTPEELLAANPGLRPRDGLFAGTPINLPLARAPAPVAPTQRSFDLPPLGNTTAPGQPNGLLPPGVPGVQLGRTPPRTFFNAQRSAAPAPQPMTWPNPLRPLRLGSRNPEIEIVQRALCRIGYAITVDGDFGASTDGAIRNFQQLMGTSPNGIMTPETWRELYSAMNRVDQPSQVLVAARRDDFGSHDERYAYDILVALAYDDPGPSEPSRADRSSLKELMRVMRLPLGTPPTITPELVTAFANRAIEVGLPLRPDTLATLESMRLDTSDERLNYNQARAVSELFIRMLRGSHINDTSYDQLIIRTARAYGLDPALVKAIMAIESDFNPRDVSRVGAQGLMQVMPDTAADVGVPDVSTPELNVLAGVRELAKLSRRFNGDLAYIAAGYNAGPGRVTANNGVPPIQETYDYVRRFLSHYAYYRQHPPR